MKNYLIITLAIIMVASCQPPKPAPTDVAGIKVLIKEKNAAIKEIEQEVRNLEEELLKLEPRKIEKIVVTTAPVSKSTFEAFTKVQATVVSDEMVYASSETGGRILNTYVKEGQYVSKGQKIAKLDLVSMEKQLDELNTNLAFATTIYERQAKLWEKNIGSEIQYLQAKNNKEQLENGIKTLNTQLAKANVYAPISGVVDKEFLKAGEMSSPGMPIVQILNTRKIKIVADIPETNLQDVKKGDVVEVYLPALNKTLSKKITLVGRSIDPSNRTFKIEIELDNSDGMLKPNLLSEVTFKSLSVKEAISIPVDIIQETVSGDKYVYVTKVEGQNIIATRKAVTVGDSYDGNIIIETGLDLGDQLIINGSTAAREGTELTISNPTVQ